MFTLVGVDTEPTETFEFFLNKLTINSRVIHAKSDGKEIRVGGPRLLERLRLKPEGEIAEFAATSGASGQTVVYLLQGHRIVAAFALADIIRPESFKAIKN